MSQIDLLATSKDSKYIWLSALTRIGTELNCLYVYKLKVRSVLATHLESCKLHILIIDSS
jgi:hypothetical protein